MRDAAMEGLATGARARRGRRDRVHGSQRMMRLRAGDSIRKICEEPFRIFFPACIALGFLGVSLWLFYFAGVGIAYPSLSHARLMIEGFMGSLIFGFLGTAGPRITSAPSFSLG